MVSIWASSNRSVATKPPAPWFTARYAQIPRGCFYASRRNSGSESDNDTHKFARDQRDKTETLSLEPGALNGDFRGLSGRTAPVVSSSGL